MLTLSLTEMIDEYMMSNGNSLSTKNIQGHIVHSSSSYTPGGRLQYEMPGCVCWGSQNAPIMKDALCQKHTHIEGILSTLNTHIIV